MAYIIDQNVMESAKPRLAKRRQGIFWILTVPAHGFTPFLPQPCKWIRGQLECGKEGYLHWQIIVAFGQKKSIQGVRDCFGPYHCELTRSDAAAEYCWKSDTRVAGTQFELGVKPIQRNSAIDWESVWELAKSGKIESIPASIRVQSYRTVRAIASDFSQPIGIERKVVVYWGRTGSGKSRRAWEEAGLEAYPKDPRSKFWCGYRGQKHVVMDEFRGDVAVGHLLRWFDRYPVNVEIKGSSTVFAAECIWVTSNLSPDLWYPDLDDETKCALRRRIVVTHFN